MFKNKFNFLGILLNKIKLSHNTHDNGRYRLLIIEWLLSYCFVVTLTLILFFSHLVTPIDTFLFDNLIQISSERVDDRILIINIDDKSYNELGAWPWSRSRHAEILKQLKQAHTGPIFFNFLFTEPDKYSPSNDSAFAEAMRQQDVYLPLWIDNEDGRNARLVQLPIPVLANAAKGIGHILVSPDQDGIVRNVFLKEFAKGQWWNHISLQLANQIAPKENFLSHPPGIRNPNVLINKLSLDMRDYKIAIPFSSHSFQIPQVSYVDVLRGDVPSDLLRDRIILIGPSTRALGVRQLTSSNKLDGLSSSEINANILDGLIRHREIHETSYTSIVIFIVSVILLTMMAYLLISTGMDVVVAFIISIFLIVLSNILLSYFHIWLPPAASILGVWLGYLLWSWRRLAVVQSYFSNQLQRFDTTFPFVHGVKQTNIPSKRVRTVDENISLLEEAISKQKAIQDFIAYSLNSLPTPVCVCDMDMRIAFSNLSTSQTLLPLFSSERNFNLQNIQYKLMSMQIDKLLDKFAVQMPIKIEDYFDNNIESITFEIQDATGRSFKIDSSPIWANENVMCGRLFVFIDTTLEKTFAQKRANTLKFLSHDLRKPQSAILALLNVHSVDAFAAKNQVLINSVKQNVDRTMTLADQFIALTQAETSPYVFSVIDYAEVAFDAIDQVWPLTMLKRIKIIKNLPDDEFYILADRIQLVRAAVNVLENAVRYSPEETTIEVSLMATNNNRFVSLIIKDQGYGIDEKNFANIFEPFHHEKKITTDKRYASGHGLGLAQVKVTMERHGGSVSFKSQLNLGTTFSLVLPLRKDGLVN